MRDMITGTLGVSLAAVNFSQVLETVEIEGVSYLVEMESTVASARDKGHDNLAHVMEVNKIKRTLYLRRPKGRVLHHVNQYETGNYGMVTKVR
jgi:hypothetical protein